MSYSVFRRFGDDLIDDAPSLLWKGVYDRSNKKLLGTKSFDTFATGMKTVADTFTKIAKEDSIRGGLTRVGGKALKGLEWANRKVGLEHVQGGLSKWGAGAATRMGVDPRWGAFAAALVAPDVTDAFTLFGGKALKAVKGARKLSKGVPNYLNKMKNLDAGHDFIRRGGELDDLLTETLTAGTKNKPIRYTPESLQDEINSVHEQILQLPISSKQTKAQKDLAKTLRNKEKQLNTRQEAYYSLLATGPMQEAGDVIHYGSGFLGKKALDKPPALTAQLKGKDPRFSPQLDQSMDFHHKAMKVFQGKIHDRIRVLRSKGDATDADILNLHAMANHLGQPSGSRLSAAIWMHRVPHNVMHKQITKQFEWDDIFRIGVEPDSNPIPNTIIPKNKRPKIAGKAIEDDLWKAVKESDLEVNTWDLEYIEAWAGKGKDRNIKGAIKKLKELKKNKKLYELLGPDGESEISRMMKKIDKMDVAELTKYQKELIEEIAIPMSQEADWLERFAKDLGKEGLMKYQKNTPGFYEAAKKWRLDDLEKAGFRESEEIRRTEQALGREIENIQSFKPKQVAADRDMYEVPLIYTNWMNKYGLSWRSNRGLRY